MSEQPITPEEQATILQNSLQVIKQETQLMKRCLETKGKLMDALKHASNFLTELRTSKLTPKQYYELYMLVFDSLDLLSNYLKDSHPHHHLADLYELVQYAGNIIPRLYLMITVGTVYMSIPDAPVKEIMKDLIEMARGVQYPIRGLFLRYYLSQRTKTLLPEGQDSIEFVITNFIEMNKLWVRLQHQGPSREKGKRIKEREELKILVGSNLVRLSQFLENTSKDLNFYKSYILPTILEQIIQCKDYLAQEYLLDVVIQVFPDEFHLFTLDEFLRSVEDLNPNVSYKKILITLIDRLSEFAKREDGDILSGLSLEDKPKKEDDNDATAENGEEQKGEESVEDQLKEEPVGEPNNSEVVQSPTIKGLKFNLFDKFWYYLTQLDESKGLSIEELSEILNSISKLSLIYYPENYEYIDKILKFATEKIEEVSKLKDEEGTNTLSTDVNFRALLVSPIENYSNLLKVLNLKNYEELLNQQPVSVSKLISSDILDNLLESGVRIKTVSNVQGIFKLLKIVINSKSKPDANGDEEPIEYILEQEKLSKLIHLVYNKNPTIHAKLLTTLKTFLQTGNTKYTFPAVFFNSLKLIRRLNVTSNVEIPDSELNDENVSLTNSLFKFLSRVINDLYRQQQQIELSFKLYLSAATIADQIQFEEIAYEFFAQAFTIYEESISDSRLQFQSIVSIAGVLQSSRNFSKENFDTLITKTALHGSKLLKKPDQCRAVYLASHLWWGVEIPSIGEEEGVTGFNRDGKRVLECLQRSLRVADACMDASVSIELFVEILNRCLYYFIHGNDSITVKYINGLIELIQTNLESLENETTTTNNNDNPKRHFLRTLDYINSQKEIDERFQLITW